MANTISPTYAVIIPHYNDTTRLQRCLKALHGQDLSDVEIVVADNNSTQNLEGVRSEFPNVRFVIETKKGAGLARNLGIAESSAPWIMFIDSDCLPADDWLLVGREIAREGAIIGGRVDVFDETPAPRSGAEAFEAVFAFHMKAYLEKKAFLGAGNLILSRAVFEGTGPFRPAISEDVEWSQRAASTGYELAFDDRFAVSHPSRSDWDALAYKWRRLTVEAFGLTGQGGLARIKWAAKGLAMPISILLHIPRILRNPILSGGEKGRAVTTLVRLRFVRMVWMLRQAIVKSL